MEMKINVLPCHGCDGRPVCASASLRYSPGSAVLGRMYAGRDSTKIEYMEKDSVIWREFDAVFLGHLFKGSYSMSRDRLVTVKTAGGRKSTQLGGSLAIFVAKRLLRE
jgi:hypothetical protein